MKLQEKPLKTIIIILLAITLINVVTIVAIGVELNKPITSVQTEVLGAVFKSEEEPNVIEVNLVRPPRKVVDPGDVSEQNMTLANTAESPIYFRGTYDIVVENANGEIVENFESKVEVYTNENWECRDGYWYYKEAVGANKKIPCLIDAIEYSEDFSDHRDYKVYVPMVIESVEVRDLEIDQVDYWPNCDVNKIDYKRLNESAQWTTTTRFTLIG